MADSYRGVFGAIPYAIRETESWTMRVYGVIGALAAGLIATVVTRARRLDGRDRGGAERDVPVLAVAVRDRRVCCGRAAARPCCSSLVGTAAATP